MHEIEKIIEEFFPMEKGQLINDVESYIFIADTIRIKRRVLKHVVESRKDDAYSQSDLCKMFSRVPTTLTQSDMVKINNNKRYSNSVIAFKLFREENRALLVVHIEESQSVVELINCYYRNVSKTNPFGKSQS